MDDGTAIESPGIDSTMLGHFSLPNFFHCFQNLLFFVFGQSFQSFQSFDEFETGDDDVVFWHGGSMHGSGVADRIVSDLFDLCDSGESMWWAEKLRKGNRRD